MENDFKYVQVLVNIPKLDTRTFSYKITDDLKDKIKIGQILLVPFGMQGGVNAFVVGFTNYMPEGIRAKEIYEIVSEEPVFNLEYLKFLEWISQYYCTSLQNVIEAAIPSIFMATIKKSVALKDNEIIINDFSKDEIRILELLKEKNKMAQSNLIIIQFVAIISRKFIFFSH